MDVEKFVRFNSATLRADKVSKTIGYGAGTLGTLLAIAASRDTDVSTGLKQLSSSISMARYVVRFTGAIESYEALKNGSWCYGDDDKQIQRVVKLQAYSMMIYYPLENISYIGYMAPKLVKMDANWFMRNSCWAWTAYVALDMYANQLRIINLNKREKALLAREDLPEEEVRIRDRGVHFLFKPSDRTWNCFFPTTATKIIGNDPQPVRLWNKRSLGILAQLITLSDMCSRKELYYIQFRNACFFPTCLHWSLEKGLIPEPLVQVLCFAEAVTGFWRTWVNHD